MLGGRESAGWRDLIARLADREVAGLALDRAELARVLECVLTNDDDLRAWIGGIVDGPGIGHGTADDEVIGRLIEDGPDPLDFEDLRAVALDPVALVCARDDIMRLLPDAWWETLLRIGAEPMADSPRSEDREGR